MDQAELPERRQAEALALVVARAAPRKATKAKLAKETAALREASVAAIKAGCSYRRVRSLAGVSLTTLVNWVKGG